MAGIVSNFQAMRDRWAGFNLVEEVTTIAANNEEVIADYNRKQLYEKGETVDGKQLRRYRNRRYAAAKHDMNPLPGLGNPDFFLTGAFHKSIFAKVTEKSIILDATDPKVEMLVERDGEGIFGLNDDSRIKVWVEVLRPPLLSVMYRLKKRN